MSQFFIFTVSSDGVASTNRDPESAIEDVEDRGTWVLSARTRHVHALQAGDKVLFYRTRASSPQSMHFLAEAQIAAAPKPTEAKGGGSWLGVNAPSFFEVPIANVRRFSPPLPMSEVVGRLGFIKNKKRWGSFLLGGVTKIPEEDFQRVLEAAEKPRN